jgi:predicted amidophosphoribosyltransferase
MEFGVKTNDTKSYCKNCNKELNMIIPDQIFNFCSHCGAPLNLVSFNLIKEKEKIIKLKIINEMQKIITNKNDLEKLLILMEKISKN